MRIVYIHQYFATPNMAGGTRSYEFARRLVESGHQVTMITSTQNSLTASTWERTIEEGIDVRWIPVPYSNKMSYRERAKSFLKFAWLAYRCAKRIDCDVIFATSTPLTVAIPGVYAARSLRVPLVFEVRDLWPEMPIAIKALKNPLAITMARSLEKFAYRNSKHIIALSPGMKEGVVAAGHLASEITVIPNFCNPVLFRTEKTFEKIDNLLAVLRGKKIVLYAGTIGALNNLNYLVDIAIESEKINRDIIYMVTGDGSGKDKMLAKAEKAGILDKNFFVFPQTSKEQMPAFFRRADMTLSLFVDIKEMWANSANKFFDGLASGKPVAINYQGWQAEILIANNAGVVLPPSDPKASAEIITKLLFDDARVKSMSANASRLANEDFSDENAFKKFERVLLDAIS